MKWKQQKGLLQLTKTLGLALLCQLVVAACSCDPNETKYQYMPDMVDGPQVKAQRSYIDPPEHAVARNAILYPNTVEEAEAQLTSPYPQPASAHVLEEGKKFFNIYCSVCHGESGKGGLDTPLKGSTFPPAPDLTSEMYTKRGDGFFFYSITNGSAIMPPYGDKISPEERWEITHYLRTLQNPNKAETK
jgi:mono/diheme cytochrome c family protein